MTRTRQPLRIILLVLMMRTGEMTHPWKENIDKHLRLQPDQRPDVLQIKSEVERKSMKRRDTSCI